MSAFASRLHAENGIENARSALPDLSRLSAVSGYGFPTGVHGAEAGVSAIRAGPPGSFLGSASQPDSVRHRIAGRALPARPVSLGYLHGGCGRLDADLRRDGLRTAASGARGDGGRRLEPLEECLCVLR